MRSEDVRSRFCGSPVLGGREEPVVFEITSPSRRGGVALSILDSHQLTRASTRQCRVRQIRGRNRASVLWVAPKSASYRHIRRGVRCALHW